MVGPAKEMVKLVEDIDEIWKVLKDTFGDPKVLLNCKLGCIRKLDPLRKIKDYRELSVALAMLGNSMENLSKTAKTHKIEYELYNSHSEGMIYEIMGDQHVHKFLERCEGRTMSCEEEWNELKDFLRDESKRKGKMAMRCKPSSRIMQNKEVNKKNSNTFYTEECVEKTHEVADTDHQTNVVTGVKPVVDGNVKIKETKVLSI